MNKEIERVKKDIRKEIKQLFVKLGEVNDGI